AMRRHRRSPDARFAKVEPAHVRKVLSRIRRDGPISIRDIDDDVLVQKDHAWASRKPSKRALQMAFYSGDVTVNERLGMLKRYELTDRHFDWEQKPRPATERQVLDYLLDRALLAQGVISLESACYLDAGRKPALRTVIEGRVKRKALLPVTIEGMDDVPHWVAPNVLDAGNEAGEPQVRLLSPFDPLVIQRRRLRQFFGYEHLFEAYVPKARRVFGYFALPVLVGDAIVAAIDLKCDRAGKALLIQNWTWMANKKSRSMKAMIESELDRFERFQLAFDDGAGEDVA
ncbi:MAG: DNA glycosylase AlkZ-like family protein, partial [Hyphomicrobiaceae bacterium]